MSPNCQNCGSFVTKDYVRVFSRGTGEVEVCPECPDRIRDAQNQPREARSARRSQTDTEYATFDEEKAPNAMLADGGQEVSDE